METAMIKTQEKISASERFKAAISERQRLRNRFRKLTAQRERVPRQLWQQLYLSALEVERLKEEGQ
jgi:hypothetical protein